MMPPRAASRSALLGLSLVACDAEHVEIPSASYSEFRDEVYPILVRDCGFVRCHGDTARFFVVLGPGRARLDPTTNLFDPPTDDELWSAYQNARGMLASDRGVLDSPLLTKPVDGRAHGGLDRFGRNVWEPGAAELEVLERWAGGIP